MLVVFAELTGKRLAEEQHHIYQVQHEAITGNGNLGEHFLFLLIQADCRTQPVHYTVLRVFVFEELRHHFLDGFVKGVQLLCHGVCHPRER